MFAPREPRGTVHTVTPICLNAAKRVTAIHAMITSVQATSATTGARIGL
jgi:hypothetical protein